MDAGLWEDNGGSRSVILRLTLSGTHNHNHNHNQQFCPIEHIRFLGQTKPNQLTVTNQNIYDLPNQINWRIIWNQTELPPSWLKILNQLHEQNQIWHENPKQTKLFKVEYFPLVEDCVPSHTRWQQLCRPLTNHGMSWKTAEHLNEGKLLLFASADIWIFSMVSYIVGTRWSWLMNSWKGSSAKKPLLQTIFAIEV